LSEPRFRQVSVIGAAEPDETLASHAEAIGRGLAEAGCVLVCGGRTGVMEAASRGATEAGGEAIGILMSDSLQDGNEYLTHAIATGIGQARNLAVVASGQAVIAIGGSWGTLSEIAFARKLGRFVVSIDSWELSRAGEELGIVAVETPEEAVAAVVDELAPG
jgi:uncharacterized protein (TIGR00725 family)